MTVLSSKLAINTKISVIRLSEDKRLIMSKEGVPYVDVELVCLNFDEFLKEYKLSIHQIDGKRLLRWMRHIRDHQGEWNMYDIENLEI